MLNEWLQNSMKTHHSYLLAIDLGKESSVALLGERTGKIVKSPWKFSHCLEDYQQLIQGLDPKQTLVGFEATGHYWLSLYDFLTKRGFEIVVLNPLQVKSFRNSGIRGQKTDKIDAKLILDILLFSDRPLISERDPVKVIELRNLCRLRVSLSQEKINLSNKLIGILDIVFPEYQKILSPKRVASLALLKKYPLPEKIASLPLPQLTRILKEASRRKKAVKWAKEIQEKARQSIGAKLGFNSFGLEVKIVVQRINQVAKQIKRLDREIKKIFNRFPESKNLLTIPGISHITGATILAEIGNIEKFRSKDGADKLVAWAGLDPRVKQSGKYTSISKMSKRGSPFLRSALWQSAISAERVDPGFKNIYLTHKKRGKHHKVCRSYVAKKLARVVYSVLANNQPYHPLLSSH